MVYGTVEKITSYPAKGEEGKILTEGRFIENLGLEGDFHARGGDRQVSLLLAESRERITDEKNTGGLCLSRFSENIAIRGLAALAPGVRLSAGGAVLEITGETKHCHEECKLYEGGKSCPLAGLNLFARVLKGGCIRVGDRINLASSK